MSDNYLYLTKRQIESFVNRIRQPKASVLLHDFFNSYRHHLDSNDVKELYDDEYLKSLLSTSLHALVDGKYRIHIYNKFSYEYVNTKPSDSSILDVGCGDGDFILALAFHGYNCKGVDFSETLIKAAQMKNSINSLNARFICADINNLSESESFDYIVMNDVIEHLSDRELKSILSKLIRLLRPGGEIIIHTPNGLCLCNETAHSFLQYLYKSYLRFVHKFNGFERTINQLYYDQIHINIKSYQQLMNFLIPFGLKSKVFYDEHSRSLLRTVLSSNMLVIAKRM